MKDSHPFKGVPFRENPMLGDPIRAARSPSVSLKSFSLNDIAKIRRFYLPMSANGDIGLKRRFLLKFLFQNKDYFFDFSVKREMFSTPLSPSCEEGVLNPLPSPLLFQKGEECSWRRYSSARVLVSAAEPLDKLSCTRQFESKLSLRSLA